MRSSSENTLSGQPLRGTAAVLPPVLRRSLIPWQGSPAATGEEKPPEAQMTVSAQVYGAVSREERERGGVEERERGRRPSPQGEL
jgi:hypothetical protein